MAGNMTSQKSRPWTWRTLWICCLISTGQIGFGYPASIIGTTLGQPAFLKYMNLVTPDGEMKPGADGLTGAMSGVFQAGAFFSVIIASWVSDKWGRKMAFAYCSVLSIIGGALLCAAQNTGMFIAFRFFAGAGSWGFLSITPVYVAELAPTELRGFFVGINGVMITLGYALASYMGLAFYDLTTSDTQWRGPLGIALVWPALILFMLPFLPQSPRWLLMSERPEEAWNIISKLHTVPDDPNQTYARREFYQMREQTKIDVTLDPSWYEMFRRPSYRKRCILAVTFAFLSQSAGPLVITNYGPTIYQSLGFGTRDQLRLLCGYISVGPPANLIGSLVVDRWGRRPLMALGVGGCCLCLVIEAAMVATYGGTATNKAGLGVGVFALYFFIFIYSIGVDVGGYVFYTEIFPNHLRAKGLALAVATNALTDLVYLQVSPTSFAHIGWKFFLVFIIISGLGFVWVIWKVPETKGIPLEEMAAMFGDEDEVAVYARDIHTDSSTKELVVTSEGRHGGGEANEKTRPQSKQQEHIEDVVVMPASMVV